MESMRRRRRTMTETREGGGDGQKEGRKKGRSKEDNVNTI